MAKSPTATRLRNILSVLNGGFNFAKDIKTPVAVASPLVVSNTDRDKLLRISMQSETPRPQTWNSGTSGFLLHAQKTLREISHNKVENERILEMAPEVSQAASIMVPSILSPNDLRSSAINITSTCEDVTDDQNKRIGKILTDYFEDEMSFSVQVPNWIHEALYRSGAQPILILPIVELQKQLTQGAHVIASQEAYQQKINQFDSESWYGVADARKGADGKPMPANFASVITATESLVDANFKSFINLDKEKPERGNGSREPKACYQKLVSLVLATEALTIVDNPSSIQFSEQRTRTTKQEIKKKARLRYKDAALIALERPDENDKQIQHPLFMPLPAESVIPVYTPGAPSDHIGYFVLLNEYGHPIEVTAEMANALDQTHQYTPNQSAFQQLFQAYGMGDFLQGDQHTHGAMADVYQNIVEAHLKDRLTHAGFGNLGVGKNNNVYRYMLSRYLQQRRTKLLFIPKDLLTYFTFKVNEYGVGESKLNELKFILALRISLIVCRMLVAFNNAIDRKQINIRFDSNFSGNILEHMRTVQREAMRKSAVSFTHDPMAIAQQIVNKSYTVKASGITGLPDYEISSEANQRNDPNPDEQLSEDLKNLLILKLEVPAAAMNNLGEAEYSRSVVTTNLFFARSTMAKQKVTMEHLDDIVQKYVTYSQDLTKKILEVLSTEHNDGVTPEGSTNEIDYKKFTKVLKGIKTILPPPNVAPDKAQFDALDGVLGSIDTILGAVMNDDIANGDQEILQVLQAVRGISKSRLVKKYIQDFGFGDMDIPDPENLDQKAILDLRQVFINVSTALKQQAKVLNAEPPIQDNQFGAAPGGFDAGMGGGLGDMGAQPDMGGGFAPQSDAATTSFPPEGEEGNTPSF